MKKIKTITFELTKADITRAIKSMLIEDGEINEDDKITIDWKVQDIADDRFGGGPNYSFTRADVKIERKD